MGRIADYVQTLTPAEREMFKDLIEECTVREESITRNAERASAALSQLAAEHDRLLERIEDLQRAGEHLQQTVGRLYLQTVPTPDKMH